MPWGIIPAFPGVFSGIIPAFQHSFRGLFRRIYAMCARSGTPAFVVNEDLMK